MLSSRRLVHVLAGCLVLILTGCTKVKDEKSFELQPGETKTFEVPVQKSDMKLTVEVVSDKAPIQAFIRIMEEGGDGVKYEGQKERIKETTITAEVPANKHAAVMLLQATEATNVTVKITGK